VTAGAGAAGAVTVTAGAAGVTAGAGAALVALVALVALADGGPDTAVPAGETGADADDAGASGRSPDRDAVLPVLRLGVGLTEWPVAVGLSCPRTSPAATALAVGGAERPEPKAANAPAAAPTTTSAAATMTHVRSRLPVPPRFAGAPVCKGGRGPAGPAGSRSTGPAGPSQPTPAIVCGASAAAIAPGSVDSPGCGANGSVVPLKTCGRPSTAASSAAEGRSAGSFARQAAITFHA